MSTPLTDEQLRDWEQAVEDGHCSYATERLLQEVRRLRAILFTLSTNTAGPEPADALIAEFKAYERRAAVYGVVVSLQDFTTGWRAALATPIAPATAGPEPQCRPTWTECQRCKNDFAKCDGVFGAPIAQPPASPTDVHSTERSGKSPEAVDDDRADRAVCAHFVPVGLPCEQCANEWKWETESWPRCTKAPAGWMCTRDEGHDGPCAAVAVQRPADQDPLSMLLTSDLKVGHVTFKRGVPVRSLIHRMETMLSLIEYLTSPAASGNDVDARCNETATGAQPPAPEALTAGQWQAARSLIDESDKGRTFDPDDIGAGKLVLVPRDSIEALRRALSSQETGKHQSE